MSASQGFTLRFMYGNFVLSALWVRWVSSTRKFPSIDIDIGNLMWDLNNVCYKEVVRYSGVSI